MGFKPPPHSHVFRFANVSAVLFSSSSSTSSLLVSSFLSLSLSLWPAVDAAEREQRERVQQEKEEERDRADMLNEWADLQTQDFRLSDYVRRFQHNRCCVLSLYVVCVCMCTRPVCGSSVVMVVLF